MEYAASLGSVTVGINAQSYMIKKYGDKAVPLLQRAYVLNCNKYVDSVVVFKEDEPSNLIYKLAPDFYVKGPDYNHQELPEKEALEYVGAEIRIHQKNKIQNSSVLVENFEVDKSIDVPDSIVHFEKPKEPLGELFPITF